MNDYGDDDLESVRMKTIAASGSRRPGPGYGPPDYSDSGLGIISLVWTVATLIILLVAPDAALYNWQVDMLKNQPQNQQQLPPYEEFKKSQTTQSIISGLLGMVGSFFILFGGMKMKNLESYGLAIAGSIFAMIPCNCCCCIGLIPGIWSLIVLLNSDVRLAFSWAKARPAV